MDNKTTAIKTISYIVLCGLSLLTTICIAQVSHYGITGFGIVLPCVFALCILVYNKAWGIVTEQIEGKLVFIKKDFTVSAVFGLVVSLATVIGSHIDMDYKTFSSIGLFDVVYAVFLFLFFTAVFRLLFFSSDALALSKSACGVTYDEKSSNKKHYIKQILFSMVVMIVCWLPYYLTYFPGGIGNDDFECAQMCLGLIPWTNHHPVLYVAILNVFIKIAYAFGGGLTAAFGIMSSLQTILLSATLAIVLAWMDSRGAKRAVRLVSLAFFAFHPIMAMYSIYVTKDILFSCVVTLLVLFLMDFISYGKKLNGAAVKKKYYIVLGILSILTMLTRNNGTLIIAVLAVVMLVVFKKNWKGMLLTFLIVFAFNGLYKGPVWSGLGIEKQSFAESASIPLSQVAYTIYTDGTIDSESRDFLEALMPFSRVKEEFQPGYTDSYKFSDSFDKQYLDNNAGEFMKVWLKLLPSNFGRYVEAYLMQTSGYWSYGVSNTVATAGVVENDLGIEGIDFFEKMLGRSIAPLLEALVLVARKLPILCLFSQMAIQILAVLVVCCNYFRRGNGTYAVALLPLIVLWISVMIATPAHCLFRYMFPIFILWPVLLFVRADR